MKIFCLIQCSNLGGMEKVTLGSLSLLKSAGHDVNLFSLHPVGDLKALAYEMGIPLAGTRKYRLCGLGNVVEILRMIKQCEPDRIWVVGHNFGSLLGAKLSGRAAFMSIHYHHSEHPMRFWKMFYSVARKVCSGIHFVSHYIYKEVSFLFDESDHIVCFPNMLREPGHSMSRQTARAQLDLPVDAFVVGNAGWLIPRKAFDIFLQTAALIHQRVPSAVFVIAGDGPEREPLKQLALSLGIGNAVKFLGWRKDLSPFYASLDVLLFNSNLDAIGQTPLEALCHDVPIVVSVTNGGLNELIRHGIDGFLIDEHDIAALSDEVVRLCRDKKSRLEMVAEGRSHVQELCSPSMHLEHLNHFLELA